MLNNTNVEIDTVEDGKSAFEEVKNFYEKGYSYMVILMDINMPIFDGLDATRMIRKYEKQFELPPSYIIGISADNESLLISKIKEYKMDEFMEKPISKCNLHQIILERAEKIGIDVKILKLD